MRWTRGRGRGEIEDRRGQPGGGFGGFPLPIGRVGAGVGGAGIIGVIVVVLLIFVLGGGNGFGVNLPSLPGMPAAQGGPLSGAPDPNDETADFVAFVVDDVQHSWSQLFAAAGRTYQPTTLVLFSGGTQSGCGPASADTGPFYCPADRKVYLDTDFFRELSERFHAPGDFAQAYVIAHEFGHHVQNLLGVDSQVSREEQAHPDEAEGPDGLSVRVELQADCYAGVWAFSAYQEQLLETGDLEEGLAAAAAVGDDRIQKEATGHVNPDTFTHGTSEQRVRWFRTGFQSGDADSCDTFSGDI